MDSEQRQILLKVAKDTIVSVLRGGEVERVNSDDPELTALCGCFVTLKNGERLRGCIGQFVSEKPLIELIADMAKASAVEDARFFSDRITADELEQIDIEISVLSELKLTNEPLSLRLGIDGIYIKRGGACGCFLPQVAEETVWDKEEFLSFCCSHKAGLSPDAWKQKGTEVYLFTAEVFGDSFKSIS